MKFAAFAFTASLVFVAVSAKAVDNPETEVQRGSGKASECIIDEIFGIKAVAEKFKEDVIKCNEIVTENEQSILDSIDNIIDSSENISDIYKGNCQGGKHIGPKCRSNILEPIIVLIANVIETGKEILSLAKTPSKVSMCALNATRGVGQYFEEFPGAIKTCIW